MSHYKRDVIYLLHLDKNKLEYILDIPKLRSERGEKLSAKLERNLETRAGFVGSSARRKQDTRRRDGTLAGVVPLTRGQSRCQFAVLERPNVSPVLQIPILFTRDTLSFPLSSFDRLFVTSDNSYNYV